MDPHQQLNDAWLQLHYARLCRSAWLLVGKTDEAEELVQESLVIALESLHRFRGNSELYTWVYAIMLRVQRNRQRSWIRAKRRIKLWWEAQSGSLREIAADPAAMQAYKAWQESLWGEVSKLPYEQQQVIVMRYGEEMSCREIAQLVNCPEGTVRSRLHYGLLALKKQSEAITVEPTEATNLHRMPLNTQFIPKIFL